MRLLLKDTALQGPRLIPGLFSSFCFHLLIKRPHLLVTGQRSEVLLAVLFTHCCLVMCRTWCTLAALGSEFGDDAEETVCALFFVWSASRCDLQLVHAPLSSALSLTTKCHTTAALTDENHASSAASLGMPHRLTFPVFIPNVQKWNYWTSGQRHINDV